MLSAGSIQQDGVWTTEAFWMAFVMQSTRKAAGATGQKPFRRRPPGRTRLQQAQKDNTRQELLKAANRLFTESSYAATTVDDIVSNAGVSRTTFYRHFSSRLAIAEALFREAMVPAQAIHERLAAYENPNDRQIADWANAIIDHLVANRSLVRTMREVEAIEPTSDSATEDTHRQLIKLYGRKIRAFRMAASNAPAQAEIRIRAQLLMLQFDQFFYAVAVRESIDRKVGVRVMVREFRRFVEDVAARSRSQARLAS